MMNSSTPDERQAPNQSQPVRSEQERRPGLTPVTLFLVLLVAYVLTQVTLVLILTLLAVLFATVIERPLQHLERRHVPRPLGILLIYVALLSSVGVLSFFLTPVIANQAMLFQQQAPDQLGELRTSWQESRNPLLSGFGERQLERAIEVIEEPPAPPAETAMGVLISVGGGIFGLLVMFVIAFYYLMEKSLLRRLVLMELAPASRSRVNRLWDEVEAKVGGWLRGQLTLCLVIGVSATIGYGILDVPFWPLLGLWAGITEIIPILGPWLGGVPAVVIAMTVSVQLAIMVAIFILLLQLLENTVLVPRIMKGAVGLTPLTVFVAILAGTEFMGIAGALLAIPVAALVQLVLSDYLAARRGARQDEAPALPGWRWMRGPLHSLAPPPLPVESEEAAGADAGEDEDARKDPEPPSSTRGWTNELLARASRGRSASNPVPERERGEREAG